jgi:hypothetical protein
MSSHRRLEIFGIGGWRGVGGEDEAHGPPCAFIRASGSQGWPFFASRRLPIEKGQRQTQH